MSCHSSPVFRDACLTIAILALVGGRSLVAQQTADEKPAADKKATEQEKQAALEKDVTQGALRVVHDDGTVVQCPLKHTDVKADVSGFIARVTVTQTFYNPTGEKIEAVYVFPLPHEAAVDAMDMVIGDRHIVGLIKRRAEARRIYEQALLSGQTAALLEQERPNIFTQSVGNIAPGQEVKIEISYVDVLRYDMGTYEFHFPMVVGPRFNPGAPIAAPAARPAELQGKVSPPVPDTTRVPDASRISPPVLKPGHRTGHDVSLSLTLDAGVPIQKLRVTNHDAEVKRDGNHKATVKLSPADSIPNKDFVLRYDVVGKKPEMAVLAHTGDYTDTRRLGQGYFMLMIQPKEDERLKKSPPREVVFLVDVSGSMRGRPTAKVVEAMQNMLKLCRDKDTVQVITFAGQARQLFQKPVPVTDASIQKALNFTSGLRGSGGTHMLKGIKLAIDQPIDPKRLRIVVMLTDGYIGNEAEIIQHVGKKCGDQIRFWAIGIGQSPNMFLVDGVAKQGGGMGKKLGLNDDTVALTQEVMARIQRAQLANVSIDWGGLSVAETYPARIPELWAGRPVILLGRYSGSGRAEIAVKGRVEGEPVRWTLAVDLPQAQPRHDVLAKVWARRKIEDLMHQTYYVGSPAVEEEVTSIALDYRLMSQYTSFVAVDEKDADKIEPPATPPRRMLVPVPLPEGTQWEGFFGPLGEGDKELEVAGSRMLSENLVRQPTYARLFSANGRQLAAVNRIVKQQRGIQRRTSYSVYGRKGKGMSGPARGRRYTSPSAMFGVDKSLAPLGWSGAGARFRGDSSGPAVTGEALALRLWDAEGDGAMAVGGGGFTVRAMAEGAPKLTEAAQKALKSAQAHQEKDDREAARLAFTRAYFLDGAVANRGAYTPGEVAGAALAALEELHGKQIEAWQKSTPALKQKLDLVLRDQSIAEALAQVGKAAGIDVTLLPGSLEDAASLVGPERARVSYLDLRRATLAQALDWILQPARMTWRPANGGIVAGTVRRLPGSSAWVYDVSVLALPLPKGFEGLDHQKALAAAKKVADEFLIPVRLATKADENSILWFGPGQLLVVGDAALHGKVAALLVGLPDPKWDGGPATIKLHAATIIRAKERREALAKLQANGRKVRVAVAHETFGWQLLATAAGGRLDLEALTELQIAWKSPATAELVEGPGRAVVMRSWWIVAAASRLLPDEKELAALAETALKTCQPKKAASLAALKKQPDDPSAFLGVLYAALAAGDSEFTAAALPLLSQGKSDGSPLAAVRPAARSLLVKPEAIDGPALVKLLSAERLRGNDLVLIAALACRRAGGDAWTAFRAERGDLLGKQPLAGNVVVLVSRLSGAATTLLP